MKTTNIYVKGMHCRSCELRIEDALAAIPGIQKVLVNHVTGKVDIQHTQEKLSLPQLEEIITNSGYAIGQETKPRLTSNPTVWKDVGIAVVIIGILSYLLVATNTTELLDLDIKNATWFWGMLVVWLIAGFSTCMAVVGGIILSLAAKRSQEHQQQTYIEKFKPQAYFHIGRLVGFAWFWGLLGLLGSALQISDRWYMILFLVVWIVMLLSGLQLTQLFPKISAYHIGFPKSVQRYFSKRWKDKGVYIESGVAGMATFFVPCGFTIIAQAYAASTGNFWIGAVTMLGFALGTLPGLLSIGGLTAALQWKRGQRVFRWLGVLLVMFAIYNISLASNYIVGLQHSVNTPDPILQSLPDDKKSVVDISIVQDGRGYQPNTITIPKNSTINLTIDSQDQYTCASSFWIPSKNIKTLLNPGINKITFTTNDEDRIVFGCSMMMYKGQFIVQ
jgi:sulfite exporter TauE/SafE/copper chaperone CopZ